MMAQNNPNMMTHTQQEVNGENNERPTEFAVQQFGQSSLEHIGRIQTEEERRERQNQANILSSRISD